MSVERFKQHVDFLHAGKVPHIHICATGEPFLHKGIMQMIDYTIGKYGAVSFQSNFNPSIIQRYSYIDRIIERKRQISYIACDFNASNGNDFSFIKKGSSIDDMLKTLCRLSSEGIHLNATFILTKDTYRSLLDTIGLLARNEIRMTLTVVNIFPYMFNDFTAIDKVYRQRDREITAFLEKAQQLGQRFGIKVNLPEPFDSPQNVCSVFWEKIQVWPVAGINPARLDENIIPHGCNAVVLGGLNSLGYMFDFKDVMEMWNSPQLVRIREKILTGLAPDPFCAFCPCGSGLKTTEACA